MTIKEFSHKHSLVFFWATIILVVLFLLTSCIGCKGKHMMMKKGYGYDNGGYERKIMNKPDREGQQGQMMYQKNTNTPETDMQNDENPLPEIQ